MVPHFLQKAHDINMAVGEEDDHGEDR
jgi:hypothetical protein